MKTCTPIARTLSPLSTSERTSPINFEKDSQIQASIVGK